jgi:hypothetical protein
MMDNVTAFPLHWPNGRPRTKYRKRANFHRQESTTFRRSDNSTYTQTRKKSLTIGDSRDRLLAELSKLGGSRVVISSNLRLRNDGLPVSAQSEPIDPGIAVYFQMNKQPHCLSCDTWDRAADNLAAIAKHVEAMRGQLRWGVADVAAMFAGFKALPGAIITPAQMSVEDAAQFIGALLGIGPNWMNVRDSADTYRTCYRTAAKKLHPDANGGETRPEWHQLQQAQAVLDSHHATH